MLSGIEEWRGDPGFEDPESLRSSLKNQKEWQAGARSLSQN